MCGNYALGLNEQLIFPEISYDQIDKIRGMNIVICTTANTDEEAKELPHLMGALSAGEVRREKLKWLTSDSSASRLSRSSPAEL